MKFGLRYCNTGRYIDPAKAVELVQALLLAALFLFSQEGISALHQ